MIAVGAALCVSIVWAAIGFLAMALGLICVQIPTRRAPISGSTSRSTAVAPASVEQIPASPSPTRAIAAADSGTQGDELAWNDLLDRDEDLANVERLLSRYGAIYVDHFRKLYGIFNSKALLPSILKLIVESARHNAVVSANVLGETPVLEGQKFENVASLRTEQPIAVADSIAAPFSLQSSVVPHGDKSFCSGDLPTDVEPLKMTNEVTATVDPQDLVNFTSIFDKLNRSSK
ncbi:hypothetical protein [Bradyrhizobium genosp. A]|uniref:hypothetical protein n=1 Tax=Bradyrhizobium genosp. A TaxID=83626 RepID=UPI003CEE6379